MGPCRREVTRCGDGGVMLCFTFTTILPCPRSSCHINFSTSFNTWFLNYKNIDKTINMLNANQCLQFGENIIIGIRQHPYPTLSPRALTRSPDHVIDITNPFQTLMTESGGGRGRGLMWVACWAQRRVVRVWLREERAWVTHATITVCPVPPSESFNSRVSTDSLWTENINKCFNTKINKLNINQKVSYTRPIHSIIKQNTLLHLNALQ